MAINFNPFQFPQMREFKKPQTITDALRESEPLFTSALKDVKDYREQQDRRKTFNDAMEGDRTGYEWYDENDPAHKAMVDEWIRTGNAGNILIQRNMWNSNKQAEAERKAEEDKLIRSKMLDFDDAMSGFKAQKESNYTPDELIALGDKGQAAKRIIAELSDMGQDVTGLQKQWDEVNAIKKAAAQASVDEKAEADAIAQMEEDMKAEEAAQKAQAAKDRAAKRKANLPNAKDAFKALTPGQRYKVKQGGQFTHGGFTYTYNEVK